MSGSSHPSPKTLHQKLRAAQEAIAAGRLSALDSDRHVVADIQEHGVDEATYWALLPRLIEAALLAGPATIYAGTRPPRKSTKHPAIKNLELWAFKTRLSEFPFRSTSNSPSNPTRKPASSTAPTFFLFDQKSKITNHHSSIKSSPSEPLTSDL